MRPIEGSAPDPVADPSGCSYHLRRPLVDETCVQPDPVFRPISEGHDAACHHWERAKEVIPFNVDVDIEAEADTGAGAAADAGASDRAGMTDGGDDR